MLMRGDPGTENTYVKQLQSFLLRDGRNGRNKAYLEGSSTANNRIESFWGHLRKQCAEYWIALFHALQNDDNYTGDFIDKQLMLFCFLSKLQVGEIRFLSII